MRILPRRLGIRRNLNTGELLSFRDMFRRWAVLSLLGVLAAGVALTIMLAKVQIAGLFVADYRPQTSSEAKNLAIKQKSECESKWYFLVSASSCSEDWIEVVNRNHRWTYDRDIETRAERFKNLRAMH